MICVKKKKQQEIPPVNLAKPKPVLQPNAKITSSAKSPPIQSRFKVDTGQKSAGGIQGLQLAKEQELQALEQLRYEQKIQLDKQRMCLEDEYKSESAMDAEAYARQKAAAEERARQQQEQLNLEMERRAACKR